VTATVDDRRRPAIVLCGLVPLLACAGVVKLGVESRQPTFQMPFVVVGCGAIAAIALAAGCVAVVRSGDVYPWRLLGAAFLIVVSLLLAVLVAGVLGLAFCVVFGAVALRRCVRVLRAPSPARKRAGIGALLTVGAIPLLILVVQGPVAECSSRGATTSIPVWLWPQASKGGIGEGGFYGPGLSSGSETVGGTTYSFVCQNGQVSNFTVR
jgi:hypothetical protein